MIHFARYREALEQSRTTLEYWREVPMNEFAIELGERMKRLNVSRAELARRLGTSQAYVTKVLGGNVNFTIETMVKLALALGGILHLHISDQGASTWWKDSPREIDINEPVTFQSGPIADVVARPDEQQTAEVGAVAVSADWI